MGWINLLSYLPRLHFSRLSKLHLCTLLWELPSTMRDTSFESVPGLWGSPSCRPPCASQTARILSEFPSKLSRAACWTKLIRSRSWLSDECPTACALRAPDLETRFDSSPLLSHFGKRVDVDLNPELIFLHISWFSCFDGRPKLSSHLINFRKLSRRSFLSARFQKWFWRFSRGHQFCRRAWNIRYQANKILVDCLCIAQSCCHQKPYLDSFLASALTPSTKWQIFFSVWWILSNIIRDWRSPKSFKFILKLSFLYNLSCWNCLYFTSSWQPNEITAK